MAEQEQVNKFDLTIDDINFDGVQIVSLVDYPAIETDFVYMGKSYKFQDIDEEKRIVMGPAMIPNKDIDRYDWFGDKYIITFSENTIKEVNEKFMKELRLKNTNIFHALNINNVTIIESWIIEDNIKDKSSNFGFDLPKGTWFITMKIDNDEVWNLIKSGDLRGFSIEGFFTDILVQNNSELSNIMNDIDDYISNN